MPDTRRALLTSSLGAAALLAAPSLRSAAAQSERARTLRCVMRTDLRSLDPIWTTANITQFHGAMIYDTLFGLDASFRPAPQMVSRWATSEDAKSWTFELRDGLRFHDGAPVRARDCVASIRRWAARDVAGQHMFRRVVDTPVVDDRTFRLVLREPYPLLLDWLAKASPSVCFIMREREASTDPNQQVTETIGSGPFRLNREETRQGVRHVYDRNADYVPRPEPAIHTSGGKIVHMARVTFEELPEPQTAVQALRAGEIDFLEYASIELIEQLEADPGVKVQILNPTGELGFLRLNFLHPPFDNVLARRAMLHLVHPTAVMQASFGNERYFRGCPSLFGCGTPMENDANTAWFSEGQNIAKAAQLFRDAGYDGRPVVMIHTTSPVQNNLALLTAQWLREAGVAVRLEASDWGGVVTRRTSRNPPGQGGWNLFASSSTGSTFSNPITLPAHAANGNAAWFGWPSDAEHERLRDGWAAAATHDERLDIARRMQANAWSFVPHVNYGMWLQPSAMRADLRGLIAMPELVPFWNVRRA